MNLAGDCFVAEAPRNDIAIIYIVIASPDARDKLREAISGITISPRIALKPDIGVPINTKRASFSQRFISKLDNRRFDVHILPDNRESTTTPKPDKLEISNNKKQTNNPPQVEPKFKIPNKKTIALNQFGICDL